MIGLKLVAKGLKFERNCRRTVARRRWAFVPLPNALGHRPILFLGLHGQQFDGAAALAAQYDVARSSRRQGAYSIRAR